MLGLSTFILSALTAVTAGAVTFTLERVPGYALAHNLQLVAALGHSQSTAGNSRK